MTPLREALADYLRVRRQLGAQLKTSERMLLQRIPLVHRSHRGTAMDDRRPPRRPLRSKEDALSR